MYAYREELSYAVGADPGYNAEHGDRLVAGRQAVGSAHNAHHMVLERLVQLPVLLFAEEAVALHVGQVCGHVVQDGLSGLATLEGNRNTRKPRLDLHQVAKNDETVVGGATSCLQGQRRSADVLPDVLLHLFLARDDG